MKPKSIPRLIRLFQRINFIDNMENHLTKNHSAGKLELLDCYYKEIKVVYVFFNYVVGGFRSYNSMFDHNLLNSKQEVILKKQNPVTGLLPAR